MPFKSGYTVALENIFLADLNHIEYAPQRLFMQKFTVILQIDGCGRLKYFTICALIKLSKCKGGFNH